MYEEWEGGNVVAEDVIASWTKRKQEETRNISIGKFEIWFFSVENWWRLTLGRNTILDSDDDSKRLIDLS